MKILDWKKMLNFIYQDKRYKSAANTTQKTRAALLIILDFIASKLFESISWLLTAALAYIFLVIFYSNMVLFANITLRLNGLVQIVYALGFILTAAVFILFAFLIVAYLIVSLIAIFKPASTGAPSKTMETIKKQKVYTYLKNVWDNFTGIFKWTAPGGNRNLFLLIILSLVAFYHSWLTIPTGNIKAYKYNFLPDFVMATSKEIYKSTYPWISQIINWSYSMFVWLWKLSSTYLDKLF